MTELLVLGALLLGASLLSTTAQQTALSLPVLFIAAGMAFGPHGLGLLSLQQGSTTVEHLADLALFAVLYVDGMRLGLQDLRTAWRLPGRALLLGLPLTLLTTAVLAHLLLDLGWPEALLVGAVLSPTDPVFASAIVGREGIALPLRRLLNVESGLNDGLALPFVLGLLAWQGAHTASVPRMLMNVVAGVGLGLLLPWGCLRLQAWHRWQPPTPLYASLFTVAVAMLLYALARLTDFNEYLAAFTAGVVLTSFGGQLVQRFEDFGEQVSELLKLGALLAFGALLPPTLFTQSGAMAWAFAFLTLLVARPLPVLLVLNGTTLHRDERLAAAWFGPKGFASVVYGLLVLHSGLPDADVLVQRVALVVVLSMAVHSSTDVAMARWLERRAAAQGRS